MSNSLHIHWKKFSKTLKIFFLMSSKKQVWKLKTHFCLNFVYTILPAKLRVFYNFSDFSNFGRARPFLVQFDQNMKTLRFLKISFYNLLRKSWTINYYLSKHVNSFYKSWKTKGQQNPKKHKNSILSFYKEFTF